MTFIDTQNFLALKDRKRRRRSRKKALRNGVDGQDSGNIKTDDVIGDNVDEDLENLNDAFTMTAGGGGSFLRHVRIWSRCMMDLVRKLNNFHQPGKTPHFFLQIGSLCCTKFFNILYRA